MFPDGVGRKFILTVLGLVVLVAIIPLIKWAAGGALPDGFVIPWLAALVGTLTQHGVTNAVAEKRKVQPEGNPTMGQTG